MGEKVKVEEPTGTMKLQAPQKDVLLLLLQITAALLCGYFVVYPITDADIFWHLASGREMLSRKAFLYIDPFLYTTSTAITWVNLHWLFQIVMYCAVSAGGYPALLFVKMTTVSLAAWCLFSQFPRSKGTVLGVLLFALAVYGQRYLVPLRPGILTLLFAGLMIALCEKFRQTKKLQFAAAAILVQIAWVNCQGLFLIGPAIAGAYALGEVATRLLERKTVVETVAGNRMPMVIALPLVLIAASLVNPYGASALDLAGKLFSRIAPVHSNQFSLSIAENTPLLAMVGGPQRWYAGIIGAGVLLLTLLAAFQVRRLRIELLLLACIGCGLAFMAQRNGILFTFLSLPLLLHLLSVLKLPHHKWAKTAGLLGILLAAAGVFTFAARHTKMLLAWPHALSPFSHPVKSVRYLEQQPFEGNLFNADRYGGYLLWKRYPGCKVSSDTRLVLRSEAWFREYLSMVHDPELFDEYAATWNITRAVLPLAPVYLYYPLAEYLYRHADWNLVLYNGSEALFERKGRPGGNGALQLDKKEVVDSVVRVLKSEYAGSSMVMNEAAMSVARFCLSIGALSGAEAVLPYLPDAERRMLDATIYLRRGYADKAESVLLEGVRYNERSSVYRMNLAMFYLGSGHSDKALTELAKLLKKDPFNAGARKLLFSIRKQTKEHHE